MTQAFDVIGDVHGHANALARLLTELGYVEAEGVYRHPSRRVIFVGDFIDRGPDQRRVLGVARRMCEAGTAFAVMGNHEFNALAWATPDGTGGFLRARTYRNRAQHSAFLEQIGENSAEHREALAWFQTLPVWLESPGLRVIHACWHEPSRRVLAPCLDRDHRFTPHGLRQASLKGSDEHDAAEILLKGPEVELPDGASFKDKDGHVRTAARIRWWDHGARTYRAAALGMDGREHELPDKPVGPEYFYQDDKPVLFGHYWLSGRPAVDSPLAMCLDYSVAKGGRLLAYRWSGERSLSERNIVSVAADE